MKKKERKRTQKRLAEIAAAYGSMANYALAQYNPSELARVSDISVRGIVDQIDKCLQNLAPDITLADVIQLRNDWFRLRDKTEDFRSAESEFRARSLEFSRKFMELEKD